jgi:hypothetical protein
MTKQITLTPYSRTSSQLLVSVDGNLVGTVYAPTGRKWVSVLAADEQWVASCVSLNAGIEFLAERAA